MNTSGKTNVVKKRRRGKVPESERLRTAVACLECKRQKSKCLGGFPCDRCVSKKAKCKRVPHVRVSQETLLASEQRLSYMEAIIKTTFPGIESSLEQMKLKLAELNGDAKAREMIMHIDLRNVQQSDDNERHTFYEDVGSTSSFVARAHEIVSHGSSKTRSPTEPSESSVPVQNLESITNDASHVLSDLLRTALSSLPPLAETTRLINTFVSVAGNNTFFYFDSKWFKAIVLRIYQKRSELGLTDVNHVCLLYMGLCMGSIFAYVWKDNKILLGSQTGKFPGSTFYEHAQLLFPAVINDSSVEAVQVFFLAAMYVLAGQELEKAYIYLGIAMRAAVANGMHKNFLLGDSCDKKVAESRKRLFWSVYTIERRSAIALGRPETLPVSEIDLDLPAYCDGLDANSENANVSCMILIITVSLLTIKIHDMWFRRATDGLKFATIMDLYHSIERWRRQVPPQFELKLMGIGERSYRGAVHVHFAHNLAKITLGRPFLLLKLRYSNISAELDESMNSFASQMVGYTYKAASEIVEILLNLRTNNLLSCYSFNDYNACHAASFVMVVYFALIPSTEVLQRLNESVSILQQISQSCKYTQRSTNVILGLKDIIQQGQGYQRWIDEAVLGIGDARSPDAALDTRPRVNDDEPTEDNWGKLDASLGALNDENRFPPVFCEGSFPLDPDHFVEYFLQENKPED
ncbi:LAMI_0A00364g1_1 [Lachancea mirantina]|uniref:LAMI_0A00364g1_1 n=1 Tax=Lachancea mirantina TaxID=1230905 RepID=A0A1G4IL35_9SACH|nr:LAMI_0A00364g1_1 [Lachancea mirantina]